MGLVPPREALATLVVRAELPAAPVAIRARALLDIPADLEIEPLVALPLAEPNRAALQVELNRAALPQAVPSRAALPQAVPNLLPRVKRNPPDSPSLDFLAVVHPATP